MTDTAKLVSSFSKLDVGNFSDYGVEPDVILVWSLFALFSVHLRVRCVILPARSDFDTIDPFPLNFAPSVLSLPFLMTES
jgi:hypothetical protein